MPKTCQTTLSKTAVLPKGPGVFEGIVCQVKIHPAPAGHGIQFVRTDLDPPRVIPAIIQSLTEEPLVNRTILRSGKDPANGVGTVEHILAAFQGLAVDNARVEMTGPEPPLFDGSASEIVRAIQKAGTETIPGKQRRTYAVNRPLTYSPPDLPQVEFSAWPSQDLTVTYFLEQDHPQIGAQSASFQIDPDVFARELAPARTWVKLEDFETLKKLGKIKGGVTENAIVLDHEKIINTQLLWDNELARHKLLDLLGDLYLLGGPIRGHIVSYRGGHHANAQFVHYLRKELT